VPSVATTNAQTHPAPLRRAAKHPGAGELDACRLAIKAFGEMAGRLGELRALDDVLRLLASRMATLVRVPRCSVYLRDEETGLYRGRVAHGAEDSLIKRLIGGIEADGFTRAIVASRAPIVLDDALRDPRAVTSALRSLGVRSVMGVPMIADGEVLGIFFLDHENCPHHFTRADQDIAFAFAELAAAATVQAQLMGALRASLATVARQNDALRRATLVDDRLTRLVSEAGDVGEIARTLAELTGKPWAIYGQEHELLVLEMPPGAEGAITPPDLRALLSAGEDEVRAAIECPSGRRTAIVGPRPWQGLSRRLLVAPVFAREQRCGTVAVIEYPRRFEHFDLLVCRRAATIVALELSADQMSNRHEHRPGRGALAGSLHRHLAAARSRLEGRAVTCALGPRSTGGVAVAAEELLAALAQIAPEVAACATDAGQNVLVSVQAPPERTLALMREIVERRPGLVGGIARPYALGELLVAAAEACQVLECVASHGAAGGARVWSAEQLGSARVFLAGVDAAQLERLCEELLGPLVSHPMGGRLLLRSLDAFLASGRSVRATAAALHVHQNTIRYRLARIEQILGSERWNDSELQLGRQLCLLALRLQGRLQD
jgi:hypothetical protein